MTKKNTSGTTAIAQKVTDKIVKLMENGTNPWRKPWHGGIGGAVSHVTGRPYSMLNQMLLGFKSGEYVTFAQARKLGGNVKRGAKGNMIVFWTQVVKELDELDDDGNRKTEVFPVLKSYTVFHLDDCEGLEPRWEGRATATVSDKDADRVASDYCGREGVTLDIRNSDRAYYAPGRDYVCVPEPSQFDSAAEYHSTLFHELGHSTGHKDRLGRIRDGIHFGDKEYSREELVAELTAAFSLNLLGIDGEDTRMNSAAYLKAWAGFLKDDPRAIVVASGQAEKALRRIFGLDAEPARDAA